MLWLTRKATNERAISTSDRQRTLLTQMFLRSSTRVGKAGPDYPSGQMSLVWIWPARLRSHVPSSFLFCVLGGWGNMVMAVQPPWVRHNSRTSPWYRCWPLASFARYIPPVLIFACRNQQAVGSLCPSTSLLKRGWEGRGPASRGSHV